MINAGCALSERTMDKPPADGLMASPANICATLQSLTQKIGITLALLRELQNRLGDDFINIVGTLGNSKGYARHFEGDAHHARRLAIKFHTVQEQGYRHDLRAYLLRGARPVPSAATLAVEAGKLAERVSYSSRVLRRGQRARDIRANSRRRSSPLTDWNGLAQPVEAAVGHNGSGG
jgi:hypothetical protein